MINQLLKGIIKNTANIITSSRIVLSTVMVFTEPFSVTFWICYLCSGLSDMFDGFAARKLKQQSKVGARLDSIADLFFAAAIFIVAMKNISLSEWLWLCIGLIGLLRLVSYGIGFYKYRTYSSLHTNMNKAAGVMIFIFPLLYALLGVNAAGALIFIVALISSLEEMLIIIKSKELDRDCKSIFNMKNI